MPLRPCFLILIVFGAILSRTCAATPPLLARAIEAWAAGREDLSFTQQTRFLAFDGKVKEERVERYDPSLPDGKRWRLVSVGGVPATIEERVKWEAVKNGKPRKKVVKTPAEYLDLANARLVSETSSVARFEVTMRSDAARLLEVEKIAVVITVDKAGGSIVGIGATLKQPIRVLMGLARITGLEIEAHMTPSGEIQSASTARIKMSKLGSPMEYSWSDFKRVPSYIPPKG